MRLRALADGNHEWPAAPGRTFVASSPSDALDATADALDFFLATRRPDVRHRHQVRRPSTLGLPLPMADGPDRDDGHRGTDGDTDGVELRPDRALYCVVSFSLGSTTPTDGAEPVEAPPSGGGRLPRRHRRPRRPREARRCCPLGYLVRHLRSFPVGRGPGLTTRVAWGEYAPIFYRRDRWRGDRGVLDVDHARQARHPVVGSSRPRIATWVVLHERATGRELLLVNVHLDHKSASAGPRHKLIRKRLAPSPAGAR